jgi:peroxiredoxin
MAVSSTMLDLGTPAPSFRLPEVTGGRTLSLEDFASAKAFVVVFLCAHCPYVHHVQPELARIARDYEGRGVAIVGITSNDVAQYPQDAPEATAEFAREAGFAFPVLYDESQEVAKAYSAACTPDFFVFGPERTLQYRGQIDDSRPNRPSSAGNSAPLDGHDLRAAIDAILAGQSVNSTQKPSIGCNIKWKPGLEPEYFRL